MKKRIVKYLKKSKCLSISLLLLGSPLVVNANYTGNQILEFCKPVVDNDTKSFNAGICIGFVNAAMQAPGQNLIRLYKGTEDLELQTALTQVNKAASNQYCPPKKSTMLQLIKTYVKYLKQHPQYLHEDATSLLFKALKDDYPCPKVPESSAPASAPAPAPAPKDSN